MIRLQRLMAPYAALGAFGALWRLTLAPYVSWRLWRLWRLTLAPLAPLAPYGALWPHVRLQEPYNIVSGHAVVYTPLPMRPPYAAMRPHTPQCADHAAGYAGIHAAYADLGCMREAYAECIRWNPIL